MVEDVLDVLRGAPRVLPRAGEEELLEVHEIGPKVAEGVLEFFSEKSNRELMDKLRKAGLRFTAINSEDINRIKRYKADDAELAVGLLDAAVTNAAAVPEVQTSADGKSLCCAWPKAA